MCLDAAGHCAHTTLPIGRLHPFQGDVFHKSQPAKIYAGFLFFTVYVLTGAVLHDGKPGLVPGFGAEEVIIVLICRLDRGNGVSRLAAECDVF